MLEFNKKTDMIICIFLIHQWEYYSFHILKMNRDLPNN